MFYRNASIFAFTCTLVVAGCRNTGNLTPADLSMGGGGSAGGGGDMAGGAGGDMTMKNYKVSTVAAMRMGTANGGDYELDNVVAIALTPSTMSPHLFVQDAGGGDFSAMRTNCSMTSMTHPCTVASTVHTVAVGHSVTVKGTYIRATPANGSVENFYIDSITDNGAGTLPAVAMVALTDVQRGATTKAKWFQHVQVTGTVAAHKVYDLTPAELVYTGATKCPYQFGFGVAPSGTAGAATTLSCDASCSTSPPGSACVQPTGAATPDPTEVIIGTDFYTAFTLTSDCRCASKFSTTPVTMAMSTTKLGGVLLYESVFGSMPAKTYQYLAPLDNTNDVMLQ